MAFFVNELVETGLLEKECLAVMGYRGVRTEADAPLFNAHASIQDEIDKIAGHLGLLGITRSGLLIEGNRQDRQRQTALRARLQRLEDMGLAERMNANR